MSLFLSVHMLLDDELQHVNIYKVEKRVNNLKLDDESLKLSI
jgi:hypothetical protein